MVGDNPDTMANRASIANLIGGGRHSGDVSAS